MMTSVRSAVLLGLNVLEVHVEVDIANGLPAMTVVGLPDKAVDEARERVRAAIRTAAMPLPAQRITINLAPADVRKEGPAFDLPMAVGILASAGQVPPPDPQSVFVGELSLGGDVKPVRGVLPVAAAVARTGGTVYVPAANGLEAAMVDGLKVYAVPTLQALVDHLKDECRLNPVRASRKIGRGTIVAGESDLADIRGQASAKRALEIAAAGGHNLMLTGPPGTGKTLLARAMAGILPPLDLAEMLEVTAIYSVAGLLPADQPLLRRRPFRNPHHSISLAGLIGGGSWPRPGELTLAHRGVLFLDEMPQFPSHVLEAMRGPLEDRRVRIARAQHALEFPTDCLVVASENPCPCGFAGDPVVRCTCSPVTVERYQQRLSGPLRDRFDLTVEVPRLPYEQLSGQRAEPSAEVVARVTAARSLQRRRYGDTRCNAGMTLREVETHGRVESAAQTLLSEALTRWQLSVRGYHRVLKVARTIGDLAGDDRITEAAVAEALQYRRVAASAVA